MPSDLAKKKAAKKKEAAKARQRTKKTDELNEEGDQPEAQTNGAESNGQNEFRSLRLFHVAAFRSALKILFFFSSFQLTGIASLTKEIDEFELAKSEARAVTGVLASHPNSTDVHISSLSLTFHGQELLADTSLELNSGRRYGLIGLNGTGMLPFTAEFPSALASCRVWLLKG